MRGKHDGRLHVFFHPTCPHCHAAIEFLKSHPEVDVVLHDVSTPTNEALLLTVGRQYGIPEHALGVPLFVRGSHLLIGCESAETTGRELLALAGDDSAIERPGAESSRIRLPLLGEIDPARYSLLPLTVLMGLSDGFNPCAMWALVYLISLIAGMQDRSKIWWLVGRKMDDLVRAAGFDLIELRTEYAGGPRPMTYMYVGSARR